MSLKDVWTVRVRRLVVAVWREDCFILSGPPPKSSCLQAECWFAEQWGHWRQPSEDSAVRTPESAISWQSSARYDGVSPRNDWKTASVYIDARKLTSSLLPTVHGRAVIWRWWPVTAACAASPLETSLNVFDTLHQLSRLNGARAADCTRRYWIVPTCPCPWRPASSRFASANQMHAARPSGGIACRLGWRSAWAMERRPGDDVMPPPV